MKTMYKNGDFILCKKNFITKYDNRIYYKKDKSYRLELGRNNYEFLIVNSEYLITNFYFDIRKGKSNSLSKYFITEKDIRKEKLKKINEISK